MKRVRWYHHVLCALFGHHWRLWYYEFARLPVIHESNTCLRCLTPITETDEGILDG